MKKQINEELLKILYCPECHNDLKLINQKNVLVCTKCNTEYKIKNNILILLKKDAEKEKN